jgi:UDP-N-acetylmuramoylalanine--D-glutamate ligase
MDSFADKRITVMGLGRFGGGVGVTRWLCSQGAHVLVTDAADEETLVEPLGLIRPLIDSGAVSLRLGGHAEEDFRSADMVVANPAVPRPWENKYLNAAREAGVPITTEIGLLVHRLPNRLRTIGVTGSAGKSTTTAMIHHILTRCAPPAHVGGNLGGSLLGSLEQIGAEDWIVLELSSAMLHWIDAWSPHVAVVTNVRPNHLDWHGDFEHYRRSKLRLLQWQRPGDAAVFAEPPADAGAAPAAGVRVVVVGEAEARAWAEAGSGIELRVLGAHNRLNAATAVAACTCLGAPGVSPRACWEALETFPGLPHRLEFVGELDGVAFYNDSKSTTPEATRTALSAFADPSRVHLIAGGYDKGLDLAPLCEAAMKCAGLYTIGQVGPRLSGPARTIRCETLERALDAATNAAQPGEVVLLSPGCASWDQFTNFEQRGRAFERFVMARSAAGAETGGGA